MLSWNMPSKMTGFAGAMRLIGQELHPASIKRRLVQVVSLKDPPEKIARGVAVGVFLGVFPTFYTGLIIAVLGARFFKYNLIAAIAGTAVSTPLTGPFIIVASAMLGSRITGVDWSIVVQQLETGEFWEAARDTALTYLAGNIILSILSTVLAYFLTRQAVIEYRKRRGAEA